LKEIPGKRWRKTNKIILAMLVVTLTGCGALLFPPKELYQPQTVEERNYIQRVEATGFAVVVSKEDKKAAWQRAQGFIGKFSGMRMQTITDMVISTYAPNSYSSGFGYRVSAMPTSDDKFEIMVICTEYNMHDKTAAHLNAKILAYYIQTGQLKAVFVTMVTCMSGYKKGVGKNAKD